MSGREPLEAARAFYDEGWHAGPGEGRTRASWHERRVVARLGDMAGLRALDVACGTGAWLALLAARGARASGIDLSERAIAHARARLPEADLRVGAAEALPFADASFELVTCLGSLEHFVEPARALAEMVRVGTPEARYLILVPNAGFPSRRLGLWHGTEQVRLREDVRSLEGWAALFGEAGLRVEARWRDLHVLEAGWVARGAPWRWPLRAAQAALLPLWPLGWQYQVYHLCRRVTR